MIVEFWTRQPAGNYKFAEGNWSDVPRQGETVHVNERAYVVHEVTWDFKTTRGRKTTAASARVLLR